MNKEDYISKVEDLTAEQIAEGILDRIVTFEELKETGVFYASKQKTVKAILKKMDDEVFNKAFTVSQLEDYLTTFPDGTHKDEARSRINDIRSDEEDRRRRDREKNAIWQEIINNPNSVTPSELFEKGITADDIRNMNIEGVTEEIIDAVFRYKEPILTHNDIPQNPEDIPSGYTDVFFWGIPSSGKTCALAAIIDTIKVDYTMADPDTKPKYGATYRHSLDNIFDDSTGIGNLPDRTVEDRTQYMPFKLKKRGEKHYRKISFFELSGEVFKYFYDIVYNTSNTDNGYKRAKVKIGFDTLQLLLNSNNQKIHFFFIDYDYQTNQKADQNGLTQAEYLNAAATYFKENNNIFKKKTNAVYVVVTKIDELKSSNRGESAADFLQNNFGSFMDVLKTRCKKDNVHFEVIMFSIGQVWFKRICKKNRFYANAIIQKLLDTVQPSKESKFGDILNG
jgi:hypothetical protein